MGSAIITGLGVVSCVGSDAAAFWRGLLAATSRPVRVPDPHAHMALPLIHLVPDDGATANNQEGQASRFARLATQQAVADAGLAVDDASRTAVVIGTSMGEAGMQERRRVGDAPAPPRWSSPFGVAASVAELVGAGAAVTSVSNACAASGFGVAIAADLIAAGEADVVVAGGVEAYSRVALACFNRLGAIDPERCRPFGRHRAGTVFGEGAAIVVLESEAHARRRGAPVAYARVAGSGWSCDAHHPTAPEPTGTQIVRAMRDAFDAAGASADTVGCVVPHGTGTALNDVVESRALGEVIGPRTDDVPLYSLKALIGHTGGAAGALAVAAGSLIARHGQVPPNVPLDEQDPECPVWLPGVPVAPSGRHVLVNAYAFGGNNVSLVLEAVAA